MTSSIDLCTTCFDWTFVRFKHGFFISVVPLQQTKPMTEWWGRLKIKEQNPNYLPQYQWLLVIERFSFLTSSGYQISRKNWSLDVWKFNPVSYRTSALWGHYPALTPLLQLITPSRASGTADHVQSLDDLLYPEASPICGSAESESKMPNFPHELNKSLSQMEQYPSLHLNWKE